MSEHTYCDRCGMEITENRHLVGQGYIGFLTSSFEHRLDLCDGCYQSWEVWLPQRTNPGSVNILMHDGEATVGTMKPGEYTGKDGRRYRWVIDRKSDMTGTEVWLSGHGEWWDTFMRLSDCDAAKAALDALLDHTNTRKLRGME